jgi:hypothetical protein
VCKDYKPFEDDLFVYSGEYYRPFDNRDFSLKPLIEPPVKPIETKPIEISAPIKTQIEQKSKTTEKQIKPSKK